MTLQLGILELVGIIACSQAMILATQLWFSGAVNRSANRALAAFILAQAIYLGMTSWAFSDYRPPIFSLYYLIGIIYLYGPLFYVYANLLTGQGSRPLAYWRHWIVPLVLWSTLPLLLDASALESVTSYRSLDADTKRELALVSLPAHVLMVFYIYWTLEVLKAHRVRVKNHFSSLQRVNLLWLSWLAALMGVMAVFLLLVDIAALALARFIVPASAISFVVTIAIINFIGVMSFRQPQIFHERSTQPESAPPNIDFADDVGKYQKSGLSDEKIEALWQRLQQVMTTDSLYLQQGLKLDDLANAVNTHSNYLSQVINTRAGVNFYDYVNGHRLAHARKLLRSDSKQTIAQISESSGFASLNAFNSHFKKRVGCTPSTYRKSADG